MKIIREEDGSLSPDMIALLVEWKVRRCNVEGCISSPTTIVTKLGGLEIPTGFCEEHYQQARIEGGKKYRLVYDYGDIWEATIK